MFGPPSENYPHKSSRIPRNDRRAEIIRGMMTERAELCDGDYSEERPNLPLSSKPMGGEIGMETPPNKRRKITYMGDETSGMCVSGKSHLRKKGKRSTGRSLAISPGLLVRERGVDPIERGDRKDQT